MWLIINRRIKNFLIFLASICMQILNIAVKKIIWVAGAIETSACSCTMCSVKQNNTNTINKTTEAKWRHCGTQKKFGGHCDEMRVSQRVLGIFGQSPCLQSLERGASQACHQLVQQGTSFKGQPGLKWATTRKNTSFWTLFASRISLRSSGRHCYAFLAVYVQLCLVLS